MNKKGKGTLKRILAMQQLFIQRLEENTNEKDTNEEIEETLDEEYTSSTETESDFQEAG